MLAPRNAIRATVLVAVLLLLAAYGSVPRTAAQTPPPARQRATLHEGKPLTGTKSGPIGAHAAQPAAAAPSERRAAPWHGRTEAFPAQAAAQSAVSQATAPSRDAATAKPEAPSASTAISSPSPLALTGNTSFDGLDGHANDAYGAAYQPPDVSIAVGPDHIVETTNLVMRIWSKTGTLLSTTSLVSFVNTTAAVVADPNVLYDPSSGHFFLVMWGWDSGSNTSTDWIAVSSGADPTTPWNIYTLTLTNQCSDYPTIGYSNDKFIVAFNAFSDCDSGGPLGAEFWVLNKAQLASWSTVSNYFSSPDSNEFTYQPARSLSSTNDASMVSETGDNTKINVWTITGVPGVSTVSASFVPVTVPALNSPVLPQDPGGVYDQNFDDRLFQAAYYNGAIYTATNVACSWSEAGDSTTRDCLRFWQLTAGGSPSVTQDLTWGAPGLYYSYPALSLDGSGNLALVFTRAGDHEDAGDRYTGRLASDAPNTLQGSQVLKAGNATYAGSRWGDFEGAGVDPRDTTQIWLAGEYTKTADTGDGGFTEWGTYIGRVTEAAVTKAELISPLEHSVLASANVTFSWTSASGGADYYTLQVGSTPAGSQYFNSGLLYSSTTSIQATGLPTNGSTIYVRLATHFSSGWLVNDYTFNDSGGALLLTPVQGTILSTAPVFTWTTVTGAAQYALWVGSSKGGNQYYSTYTSSTTASASGLPQDGSTVYVRLWTNKSGWTYNDYTFTAGIGAVLQSPTQGSTLSGNSQLFSWTGVSGATQYALWAGSSQGGSQYYNIYVPSTTTSATATGLPVDGSTVYVRLWTFLGGWGYRDYTFTAAHAAALTSPTQGATLTGASEQFSWTGVNGATQYALWVGSSQGGSQYYNTYTTGTSTVATNLPLNGSTVYVRLWGYDNGWTYTDYTFQAAVGAVLLSPTAGSTISGASALFRWTGVDGATQYAIYAGSSQGASDYFHDWLTGTSDTVTGLPHNGTTVWIRLWTYLGGWGYRDYQFISN